ncbi:MAG: ArsR family transcriptional regulator [Pseudomonadota bacterium]|nr:ArsR family transcriptional regulator [Pseudomonadota bacterium]
MTSEVDAAEVDAARERAIGTVADAVGELMRFWNFKPSLGRIWAVLYLSPGPLDAEEIEARSGLSTGNVSMSLQELLQWGVVKRVPSGLQPGSTSRRRLFVAETDMWAMVARVFRERELRLVERTIEQLEEAVTLLDGVGRGKDPTAMHQSRFVVTRVRNLLELARTGRRLLEGLSRTGSVDFTAIRDVLRARS